MEKNYYTSNIIATLIKRLTIVILAVGIIGCIIMLSQGESDSAMLGLMFIIVSGISALFNYAIGEIIEILHDIRTNSERIRDKLAKEK